MFVEQHFLYNELREAKSIEFGWLVTRPAPALEDFNVDPKLCKDGPGDVFKEFNLGSKIGVCPTSEMKPDRVGVKK